MHDFAKSTIYISQIFEELLYIIDIAVLSIVQQANIDLFNLCIRA